MYTRCCVRSRPSYRSSGWENRSCLVSCLFHCFEYRGRLGNFIVKRWKNNYQIKFKICQTSGHTVLWLLFHWENLVYFMWFIQLTWKILTVWVRSRPSYHSSGFGNRSCLVSCWFQGEKLMCFMKDFLFPMISLSKPYD